MAARYKISVYLIMLFVASFACASDNPAFFRGFRHMGERNWDEAIMYFNVSIRREPEYLPAYSQLALCYERKEDFERAKEAWEKYAEFDSYFRDVVITHIEMIDEYVKADELSPKDRTAVMERIIERDKYPGSVLYLYAAQILSIHYFDNGMYVRVIPLLERIMLYYGQDVTEDTLFKLAYSHQKEGEYREALDIYRRIDNEFRLSAEYIEKCRNLASLCYESLGDEAFAMEEWEEARGEYRTALEGFLGAENRERLRQKERKVQEQLAFMYKTEGDTAVMEKNYSAAMAFYRKVADEYPAGGHAEYALTRIQHLRKLERELFERAEGAYSKGKHKESIEYYETIINHFRGSREAPWAKFWLGMNHAAMGDFREAARSLLRMAQEHPEHSWAGIALERAGVYYWQMLGEEELARKIFLYVVRHYPGGRATDNALYYLGVMYIAREDYARGYRMLKALVDNFPGSQLVQRARLGMKHAMEEGSKQASRNE